MSAARSWPALGTRVGWVTEMPRVLIPNATTHGHAAKIATRMAAALREEGIEVDRTDWDQVEPFDRELASGPAAGTESGG
jgi:hypothetical protein